MKKPVRMLKSQAGFSLIELMIVVAIIGILASIAVPNFQKFQRRAKQTEGKGYLAGIYSAEKGFQAEWNTFTSHMPTIGFQIDAARGCYSAGINADANAVAGTTLTATVTSAMAATVVQPTAANTGCVRGTLAQITGTSYTTVAFVAGTAGQLYTGGGVDTWTMSDTKAITNTISGL